MPGATRGIGIAALDIRNRARQFEEGDRRGKEICRVFRVDPCHVISVGLAVAGLVQLATRGGRGSGQ